MWSDRFMGLFGTIEDGVDNAYSDKNKTTIEGTTKKSKSTGKKKAKGMERERGLVVISPIVMRKSSLRGVTDGQHVTPLHIPLSPKVDLVHMNDGSDVPELKLTYSRPLGDRSTGLLSIYLLMRSCMMHRPYRGVYAIQLLQIRSRCSSQQQCVDEICNSNSIDRLFNASQLASPSDQQSMRDANDDKPPLRIDAVPLHMWISPDTSRHYVPVDRAIHIMQAVLRAVPSVTNLYAVYHRLEEMMVILNPDGSTTPLDGESRS